jgi:Ca2+-binding RTX toxin-like protein
MDTLENRWLLSHVVFTLDATQSSLNLSGTIGGADFSEQTSGSLMDTFGGSINAKLINSSIQLLGSSVTADASLTGAQPSGQSDANYTATATAQEVTDDLAVRNLAINLTSAQTTITDGDFPSSGESFSPTVGNVKYGAAGGSIGTESLASVGSEANATATNSTLAISGGTMTLTIPLEGTISLPTPLLGQGSTASLTFDGQLVATAPVATGSVNGSGELVVEDTSENDAIVLALARPNIDLSDYGILTQTFRIASVTDGISIHGGAGNDKVILDPRVPAATVNGGAGDDTLVGNTAGDLLLGGPGNDSITANGGTSTLHGGNSDDTLSVTGNDNDILGGAGDDIIYAPSKSGSGDTINGGSGANTAYARKKFDTITNCTVIPT